MTQIEAEDYTFEVVKDFVLPGTIPSLCNYISLKIRRLIAISVTLSSVRKCAVKPFLAVQKYLPNSDTFSSSV